MPQRKKPHQLQVIKGTASTRSKGKTVEAPAEDIDGAAPSWLCGAGRRKFAALRKMLETQRTVIESDHELLALAASEWTVYTAASKRARRDPTVPGSQGQPVVNPHRKIAETAFRHYKSALIDLGLRPADIAVPKVKKASPWAKTSKKA